MQILNYRLNPDETVQSKKIREIESCFNRFRSGSETLADALCITPIEYDALCHGEMQLNMEHIDRLAELGFSISGLFSLHEPII